MDQKTRQLLLDGNAGNVLQALLEHEPMPVMELAEVSGLGWHVVCSGLDDLDLLGLASHHMASWQGQYVKVWLLPDRAAAEQALCGAPTVALGPRSRQSALAA